MQVKHRWSATAGVAIVGAGVIVAAPTTAPPPAVHGLGIQLVAGFSTQDAQDIVIDIVRHGQRADPFNQLLVPSPPYPGAPLSPLGEQQAQDTANQLHAELGDQVSGIFSGQGIRDQETAAPFAQLEGMDGQVQILPALDELDSGIYGGYPLEGPAGALYTLTVAAWVLGLELVPLAGSTDFNGVGLDDRFTDAIDTMYNHAMANPVVSGNGEITAVGFNNEGSVAIWALTTVKNPDPAFLFSHGVNALVSPNGTPILPTGGVVEVKGNPEDGWTLLSWAGEPIPANPGLPMELFLDFRSLIMAPQTAAWHLFQAVLTGDPTTMQDALVTGAQNVGAALVQFPESVFNDLVGAVSNL